MMDGPMGSDWCGFQYDYNRYDLLYVAGTAGFTPRDVNRMRQIVGYYSQTAWTPAPKTYYCGFTIRFGVLQEFYPSSFISNAVTLHFTGVNNKGQIVGGFTDAENRSHGFIATPQT